MYTVNEINEKLIITPTILAFRRMRQEDSDFVAGLGYTARPCI
jgi:hypothetical protein